TSKAAARSTPALRSTVQDTGPLLVRIGDDLVAGDARQGRHDHGHVDAGANLSNRAVAHREGNAARMRTGKRALAAIAAVIAAQDVIAGSEVVDQRGALALDDVAAAVLGVAVGPESPFVGSAGIHIAILANHERVGKAIGDAPGTFGRRTRHGIARVVLVPGM